MNGALLLFLSFALFGHHFASIAGAGPIVGPVLAARYGWVAVVPMAFMILTSGSAVVTIFSRSLSKWRDAGFQAGGVMTVTSAILIGMSLALIALGAASFRKSRNVAREV